MLRERQGREATPTQVLREGGTRVLSGLTLVELDTPHPQSPTLGTARRVDEELLSRNVARLVQLRVTDDRKVRSFTRAEALRFRKAAEQHRLYALRAVA